VTAKDITTKLMFAAASQEERAAWVKAINVAHDLAVKEKEKSKDKEGKGKGLSPAGSPMGAAAAAAGPSVEMAHFLSLLFAKYAVGAADHDTNEATMSKAQVGQRL
jgi:hypothetical protein